MKQGIAALLALWSGVALADCPGETQAEMNACAASIYAQADAELNREWPKVKARMQRMGAWDELLDSQRKWLAYRDAACEAEAKLFEGGSMQPLMRSMCLAALTEQRTRELRGLADY